MLNKIIILDELENRYKFIEVLVVFLFNLFFVVLFVWFVSWIKKKLNVKILFVLKFRNI